MAKLTLTDLTSLENQAAAIAAINAAFALIETSLENTLSRDGTSPNTMGEALDMNGEKIINVATGTAAGDAVRYSQLEDIEDDLAELAAALVTAAAAVTAAQLAETNAETAQANAETAEANAETAETNAETAETNAETAQAAAEAALASINTVLDELADIAALTPANDDIIQRKAGAWTNRTMVQLAADLNIESTADTFATKALAEADDPDTDPDFYLTIGHEGEDDGGGGIFANVGTEPASTPTWAKFENANGTWYKLVVPGILLGQQAGIYGNSATDVTTLFNEAVEFLELEGGGEFILPPGVTKLSSQGIVNCSEGIHIRGVSTGGPGSVGGTILKLDHAAANKLIIGGDTEATQNREIEFSRMHVTGTGVSTHLFETRSVRTVKFNHLKVSGTVGGFVQLGNISDAEMLTLMAWITDVEGNITVPTNGAVITMPNFAGGGGIINSHLEGPATQISGSSMIRVPTNAIERPDGFVIHGNTFGKTANGIEIRYGAGNWFITATHIDRQTTVGIWLQGSQIIANIRMVGSHLSCETVGANDFGILMTDADGGAVYGCGFIGNWINGWGNNGVILIGVHNNTIIGNNFQDCATNVANTTDVIAITGDSDRNVIIGNNGYKVSASNSPRSMVNNSGTGLNNRIRDNVADAVGTGVEIGILDAEPCFSVTNSGQISNVTGNGAAYDVIFDTEVYDDNANYNNTTGVFTAPIKGIYHFTAGVTLDELTAATTLLRIAITTSNRTYLREVGDIPLDTNGRVNLDIACMADMDIGDTAKVTVTVSGEAGNTIDIVQSNTSWFQGMLVKRR